MERQHQMLINTQQEKQIQQMNPPASPPPPALSSSPSHDFSFTVSFHPSAATKPPDKNKSPSPFAIDLSPADEIFFHGHLLPLHLLSHLPVSPRSSTNSLDSFTLPIKELSQDINTRTCDDNDDDNDDDDQHIKNSSQESNLLEGKTRANNNKSKPFSLFGLPKWRKGNQNGDEKRKSKFDVSHVMQRYMRLIKPFLSFRNTRRGDPQIHRQAFSLSGNLKMRNNKELRGRRGEFSAPASIRTSPTNSGLLVASGTLTPTTSTDSTMEELQAAIQAAIAHCKNSIATQDTPKLP